MRIGDRQTSLPSSGTVAASTFREAIKAEAARLALQLAEQKIAAGITPETHSSLVSAFTKDLDKVRS